MTPTESIALSHAQLDFDNGETTRRDACLAVLAVLAGPWHDEYHRVYEGRIDQLTEQRATREGRDRQ